MGKIFEMVHPTRSDQSGYALVAAKTETEERRQKSILT